MAPKISVVTGTLNRLHLLPGMLDNVLGDGREVVLVDGGSTDGTLEYLRGLNNPLVKLVEIGHRSSYPHYMNAGIKQSSGDWILIWNDDVILENPWKELFEFIEDDYGDVCPFAWWNEQPKEWSLYYDPPMEVVLNYGLVRRQVFRDIGMYHPGYSYYCCDGEFGMRAWAAGKVILPGRDFRVRPIGVEKRAIYYEADMELYQRHLSNLRDGIFPEVEKLT